MKNSSIPHQQNPGEQKLTAASSPHLAPSLLRILILFVPRRLDRLQQPFIRLRRIPHKPRQLRHILMQICKPHRIRRNLRKLLLQQNSNIFRIRPIDLPRHRTLLTKKIKAATTTHSRDYKNRSSTQPKNRHFDRSRRFCRRSGETCCRRLLPPSPHQTTGTPNPQRHDQLRPILVLHPPPPRPERPSPSSRPHPETPPRSIPRRHSRSHLRPRRTRPSRQLPPRLRHQHLRQPSVASPPHQATHHLPPFPRPPRLAVDGARLRQQLRGSYHEHLLPPGSLQRPHPRSRRRQPPQRRSHRATLLRHQPWRPSQNRSQRPQQTPLRIKRPRQPTSQCIKRPHRDRPPTRQPLPRSQAHRIQLPDRRPPPHRTLPRPRNHLRRRPPPTQNPLRHSIPSSSRRLLSTRRPTPISVISTGP